MDMQYVKKAIEESNLHWLKMSYNNGILKKKQFAYTMNDFDEVTK